MPDREKVISGLETIRFNLRQMGHRLLADFCDDALDLLKEQEDFGTELTNAVELIRKKNERIEKLLKEQEAVEPTWSRGKPFCGACGLRIHGGKYCPECGRQVKWNE